MNPYCSAIIVCDHVHRDGMSGKHTIVGTFDRIFLEKNATGTRIPFGFYASLVGGHNQCEFLIQVLHAEDYESENQPLLKVSGPIAFKNPLQPVELSFNASLAFTKPGAHFLIFKINDEKIAEKIIYAVPARENTNE
jgi:Family of unknown function (DUF6941)